LAGQDLRFEFVRLLQIFYPASEKVERALSSSLLSREGSGETPTTSPSQTPHASDEQLPVSIGIWPEDAGHDNRSRVTFREDVRMPSVD
jgi:hypothetical protein